MIGTHDQMHIYFDKFDFRYQEIFARDIRPYPCIVMISIITVT